jgi:protein-tyrosine phosphatase
MAEALLRKRLADKFGCTADELEDRGVLVLSAGIAAAPGGRAANEAVNIMRERGLDLTQHESQPLSDRLVRYADLIITMTRGHREAILSHWPDAAPRTFTLSRNRGDVADPIGGPADLYRKCADQIDAHLAEWVNDLDLDQPQ